jgi:hypothetical protein
LGRVGGLERANRGCEIPLARCAGVEGRRERGRDEGDDGLGFIGQETSVVWSVELGVSGVSETQPDGRMMGIPGGASLPPFQPVGFGGLHAFFLLAPFFFPLPGRYTTGLYVQAFPV